VNVSIYFDIFACVLVELIKEKRSQFFMNCAVYDKVAERYCSHCRKDSNLALPTERIFKVPNVDEVIEEGKKAPKKFRDMKVKSLGYTLKTEMYTASGWPSVSGDALKVLAGNISSDFDFTDEIYNLDDDHDDDDEHGNLSQNHIEVSKVDNSAYGTAFSAFPTEKEGREACHAIAALCEVSSINSLISNFILPLQVCIFKCFWSISLWLSCSL